MLVWLSRSKPSLRQRKANGPVPEATVEKVAESPGHLTRLVNAVAAVLVLTVSAAELVTLLQLPETSTE